MSNNKNRLYKASLMKKFPSKEDRAKWYEKFTNVRIKKRIRVSGDQNHRCCYCHCETWLYIYIDEPLAKFKKRKATLEHFIPQSKKGTDSYFNCVMACDSCNQERSDIDALDYYVIKNDLIKYRKFKIDNLTNKKKNTLRNKEKSTLRRNLFIINLAIILYLLPDLKESIDKIIEDIDKYYKVS